MNSGIVPVYQVRLERAGCVREARDYVRDPGSAARVARALVPDDGREHFGVVLLDIRHRLIGAVEVSVGCLTSSLVHPREVFGPAIASKAAAVVLYHNHPSGDPEPSAEDIALTRRLTAAGVLLGIEVLDHVILGDGSGASVSLKGRGVL